MTIIAVASPKGGVGKSTTAYNIALAMKPNRILDQDLHGGLQVIATLRDTPLSIPIERFDDTESLLNSLREYTQNGETILIDVGGFDSDIGRAVIAVADLIICPSNDTPTDRIGLARLDVMLEDVGQAIGRERTAYVLICKAHPSQIHFPRLDADIERSDHLKRMQSVIASRPDHYRCQEFGLGVTERTATRHSAAGKEVLAVVAEIQGLLNDVP